MSRLYNDEPDQKSWEHSGLNCHISRVLDSGHLCGYVQIPKTHPLYKLDYKAIIPDILQNKKDQIISGQIGKRGVLDIICFDPDEVRCGFLFDVHGSVTFSGELRDLDGFWYGFDCAHAGDLCPLSPYPDGVYRDMAYVVSETNSLAEQIADLTKGGAE